MIRIKRKEYPQFPKEFPLNIWRYHMYLDTVVKIPDVQGKITCRSKKGTTYVEYEYDREYLPERKYTIPKRKTIGKQSGFGVIFLSGSFILSLMSWR